MSYRVTQPPIDTARPALVRLWEENLRPLDRLQRYEWYYLNNPAGPGTTFLLESDEDGRSDIVGCTGIAPRRFELKGRQFTALLSADFAVDKNHRTAMPAIVLQRAARDFGRQAADFSYGFPNSSAVAVFLRIGYRQLGCVGRFVKVLRHEPYLRNAGYVPGLASLAARVLDHAAALRDVVKFRNRRQDLRLEWLPEFDARFDDLWEVGRHAHRIIGNRNAQWLRWRYDQQSGAPASIAALVNREANTVCAYAVVSQKEEGIARIGDFFAASAAQLSVLLGLVCRELRSQEFRSVSVYFLGARSIEEMLVAHGFVRRDNDRPVVVDPGRAAGVEGFLNPDNWYLTSADTDT
jgi:hypothetical protein